MVRLRLQVSRDRRTLEGMLFEFIWIRRVVIVLVACCDIVTKGNWRTVEGTREG